MSRLSSWDVLWSPVNPNKFVKFNHTDSSSEISLFRINHDQDAIPVSVDKSQVVKLADNYTSSNAAYSEVNSIKSIAWCPREDLQDSCILAAGLSNGHVSLINIGPEPPPTCGLLLNTEFVPKADRSVSELSWCKLEPNLLAVGLDKVRLENSLLVWDVEGKSAMLSGSDHRQSMTSKRPVYEHGISESTLSVAWLPNRPRTLVASQAPKWLRLFDLRARSSPTSGCLLVAQTKHIYGISVNPFCPDHIASFAEGPQGAVLVWDIRHPEKPMITINQSKQVNKIHWCPTRSHLISVLQKESCFIKSYDLQHTLIGPSFSYASNLDEDNEHIIFERSFQLSKSASNPLSSFSWHPSHENTILTVSSTGNVKCKKILERITMSWSPSLDLVWGCGKHMLLCSRQQHTLQGAAVAEIEDISFTMRQRAIDGYGEKTIMKDEKRLREILVEKNLVQVWIWLMRVRRSKDAGKDARKMRRFFGVKAIIKGEVNNPVLSQKVKVGGAELDGGKVKARHFSVENTSVTTKEFNSEDRRLALKLCNWEPGDLPLMERLTKLCEAGELERAAACALFHKKISISIEILSGQFMSRRAPPNTERRDIAPAIIDPVFPVVAMALSGYSEDKKTFWAEMCRSLCSQLKRPYLRAMFAFLTSEDEEFTPVLHETEMELEDRIAFACKYLNDAKLTNYVENVTTTMISGGNLEGLLLTGLTADGIDLLENYITITSDVQTSVLMILSAKVSDVLKDPRVSSWIESYEDLLDQWRLWHERALFDSLVQASDVSRKINQQISVSCTFCSKAVSSNFMQSGNVRMSRYPQMGATTASFTGRKAMTCASCRKPLPRCSICLLNMGSLSTHAQKAGSKAVRTDAIVNSFSNWFTWCQTCQHGGHASHLADWFKEHVECPVTGCTCKCNAQDSVAMVTPKQSCDENTQLDDRG